SSPFRSPLGHYFGFFFQAEDGIRDFHVTGVQTCALPIFLGGTLTLIGTSTNLVVNGQYQALTGRDGLSLFSITAVGLPVALVGLLFMWLVFPRLLPDRSNKKAFTNLREFTLEVSRSEERRVGKEGKCRLSQCY